MYRIGIIGHNPENISKFSEITIRNMLRENIDLLQYQFKTDVIFNISGDIGVGLWAADECIHLPEQHDGALFYYHLYLPYPKEITSEYWYDNQKELLNKCCNHAHSITVSESTRQINSTEFNNHDLVRESNLIICYWTGKKQGKTFNTIKYALENNKIVLNGLNGLSFVTSNNLNK